MVALWHTQSAPVENVSSTCQEDCWENGHVSEID
jgi:hypothetical protein